MNSQQSLDTHAAIREAETRYRDALNTVPPVPIADQLPYLAQAAQRWRHIIQLGVGDGAAALALLFGLRISHGHLWSVDTVTPGWTDDPLWSFRAYEPTSPAALDFLPPTANMLLTLGHSYDLTLHQLRVYVPRIRRGGLIACHGTQWDTGGVSLPNPGGPVTHALDDFCAETGRAWHNRTSKQPFYGMGLIWT